MKTLSVIFFLIFILSNSKSQSNDSCKDILGYGIFDFKTYISENELIEKMVNVTQKTSLFDASNEIGFAIPEIILPGSSKTKFNSRKDYFNQLMKNASKKEKYFEEVITANKSILNAWQACMIDKKSSCSARVTHVSDDFKDITFELFYSFTHAPNFIKFKMVSDTESFDLKQGFTDTFSIRNNVPYLLKIRRKIDKSFNVIFKTLDEYNYSIAVGIPQLVKIPIDNNSYLTVYEGLTWRCNGHHLSAIPKFRLPGQYKNCVQGSRSKPFGRITSNSNTINDKKTPVFDINGRLTNSSKGKLIGYVSTVPIEGGFPIFLQGENIITKQENNSKLFGYVYPL